MRLEDLHRFDAEVEVTKATVLKATDDYGTVESAVRKPQDDSSKWCVTRNVHEKVYAVYWKIVVVKTTTWVGHRCRGE